MPKQVKPAVVPQAGHEIQHAMSEAELEKGNNFLSEYHRLCGKYGLELVAVTKFEVRPLPKVVN